MKHGIMRKIREMSADLLVSLAASFMLFFFAPLEVYINNPNEFWYDVLFLIPYCLCLFVAAFLVSMLGFGIARLCRSFVHELALGVYFAAFLGCYIQGNFLVEGLPPFDGSEVEWSLYRAEQIKSAVVWLAAAAVTAALAGILRGRRFRALVRWASGFLFLILSVTLFSLFIVGGRHKDYLTCTKDNQFEMSADTNFVILMLDAVDAGAFGEIWENHPEYEAAMADFTYYSNAMCGYPCTDASQALILSGEWYENQEPFEDFVQRVYGESSFFDAMERAGYELSLYDAELQLQTDVMDGKFKNMIKTGSVLEDPVLFLKRQVKLVGIKYAPYALKPYCWFDAHKLWNQRVIDTENALFFWENSQFYADMRADDITYNGAKQFKYIHLEGAHEPFLYDADVNVSDDADYYTSIEACMTVVMTYLEKLRAADVYDNSVILIMSDHGLGEDSRAFTGRQHPILFVKGLRERHEFQISEAPVAYEDLMEAYSRLLEGRQSDDIFDCREGDSRTRRYLFYAVGHMGHMEEYIQTGHAADESTLNPTGRVFDYK